MSQVVGCVAVVWSQREGPSQRLLRQLHAPHYDVTIAHADETSYIARATAVVDFNGDGRYNSWEIDQDKRIKEVIPD